MILVDEQTVGFDHTLANNTKVEVFPVENRGTDHTEKSDLTTKNTKGTKFKE